MLLLVLVALGACSAFAQGGRTDVVSSDAHSSLFHFDPNGSALIGYDLPKLNAETDDRMALNSQIEARGPIVHVMKAKKFWGFPKRLLGLFNPLRPREAREQPRIKGLGGLSTRPWATVVGWHPGASAFTDAATYEPALTLFSVNPTGR